MKIDLGTVRQSPFVGIFAIATEKIAFIPKQVSEKEEKMLKTLFDTELVKTSIANSSLLGVFAVANKKGLLATDIIEEHEEQELEKQGIKVKRVESMTAIGNLIAINDSKGLCSKLFTEKQVKEIEKFLGIEIAKGSIAESDIVGASMVATNKGFLARPEATEKELQTITKHFNLQGTTATANCGDAFIANSIIANSTSALAGKHTTGHELSRIDEGLTGA